MKKLYFLLNDSPLGKKGERWAVNEADTIISSPRSGQGYPIRDMVNFDRWFMALLYDKTMVVDNVLVVLGKTHIIIGNNSLLVSRFRDKVAEILRPEDADIKIGSLFIGKSLFPVNRILEIMAYYDLLLATESNKIE